MYLPDEIVSFVQGLGASGEIEDTDLSLDEDELDLACNGVHERLCESRLEVLNVVNFEMRRSMGKVNVFSGSPLSSPISGSPPGT